MGLVAGVAVVSLLLGVAVMQFIVSPAELAARTTPPKPGPVTAPAEERVIENTVVSRGEIGYADAVDVTIDTAGSGERPVVTGHVPEVGTVLNAGNIALEIAGRPAIVLPGDLPAYRTLSVGMRGPDVTQLKVALTSMGYAAGDTSSDVFDWDTANALGTMYEQIGYPAQAATSDAAQQVRGAEREARAARVALAQAEAALAQAQAAGNANVAGEQATLSGARDALSDAQESLAKAQEAALPTLPASEAVFLASLPRRVDSVSAKRGDVLSGSPMSVSGATLAITGTVSKQDAELLKEGEPGYFAGPNGEELAATLQKIEAPGAAKSDDKGNAPGGAKPDQGAGGRYTVTFALGELTSEQIDALRGTNVRLRIPVASTDGEVIAVPIAALSAGSGGEDRIELLIDPRDGPNAETEFVKVTAGLAADGFVEVSSEDPRVKPGARVVIGR
ncbi:hypothetical protein G7067_06535 [Leucobacter insecticola]|uniref:Peptidoglycan-binding protein n=1 Tax=Leucobacter insecticola TaxID=2714934 RepID=A0A6G8FLY7_9MICO|nr:hypothetical protein G7067_06535 [Leucobacter insecticola]